MANPLDPNPDYEIDNEEIQQLLAQLGQFLSEKMPDGWGYMLNIFSFGPGGATFYISNAQRADMISNMRELIEKLEGQQ